MSFFQSDSEAIRSASFSPLSGKPTPASAPHPLRLLWASDPFLVSRLLEGIAGEAANRGIPFALRCDPLLPDRIVALTAEGLGSFTLSPDALRSADGLIDCTLPRNGSDEGASAAVERLSARRAAIAEEIAELCKVLGDHKQLLTVAAKPIADLGALTVRAERIAKHTPHGHTSKDKVRVRQIAVRSRDRGGTVLRLPFSREIRVIGITSSYCLAAHFLNALECALDANGCSYDRLTSALTDETAGILLPDAGICYLTDATELIRERTLSLKRFLLPHTTEARKAFRNLAAAAEGLQDHIDGRLAEYRAIAQEEETLRTSLYNENRLHSFRKRLLIDLFCS